MFLCILFIVVCLILVIVCFRFPKSNRKNGGGQVKRTVDLVYFPATDLWHIKNPKTGKTRQEWNDCESIGFYFPELNMNKKNRYSITITKIGEFNREKTEKK